MINEREALVLITRITKTYYSLLKEKFSRYFSRAVNYASECCHFLFSQKVILMHMSCILLSHTKNDSLQFSRDKNLNLQFRLFLVLILDFSGQFD